MTPTPPVARPAATLILVRDGAHGMEVFLLQRVHSAGFAAGAYVFPGGALDTSDSSSASIAHCTGLDDRDASRLLGVERDGLAHWIAAIRECFEESGLLIARNNSGTLIGFDRDSDMARALSDCRRRLTAGELTLADICSMHGLRLATDTLAYFSHWIAPPIAPRRFDTRFFVAEAPARQAASHDGSETIGHLWISPADALQRHQRDDMELLLPTIKTLEALCAFRDSRALMDYARAERVITPILPRPALENGKMRVLMPDQDAYAELGKLDPDRKGTASCTIVPGVVTQLSERVRRIASPNPHFMRGPGTNTYLIGAGGDIAVIDPGPAIDSHVENLLEHGQGRIRWILVTHTHGDHSPAAALLKARTGAQLIGMPPPRTEHQDQSFLPDHIPAHGERLHIAGCVLRAIHTPGHASNHLCYLLEEEQMLFTGDHIMQGSTVVINPPDGNMRDYLASLKLVQQEDIAWLAPGHGFLMDDARERIDRLLLHRQAREEKVLAALDKLGPATLDNLLAAVYADVPQERFAMAARSLLAHLLKLQSEERASERDGVWQLAMHTTVKGN